MELLNRKFCVVTPRHHPRRVDFEGPEWSPVTEAAKDLLEQLLRSSEHRLSAGGALAHRWFLVGPRELVPGLC